MKEIREERVPKREDIGFNPVPIPEVPPAKVPEAEAGAHERTNERRAGARR